MSVDNRVPCVRSGADWDYKLVLKKILRNIFSNFFLFNTLVSNNMFLYLLYNKIHIFIKIKFPIYFNEFTIYFNEFTI